MEEVIQEVGKMVSDFVKLAKQMWIDYDKEADVLYISFQKPQNADDSIMDGNLIIHKRGDVTVGLTVTNASEFGK